MLPNAQRLIERLEIGLPLIGFYDAPNPEAFEPLTKPDPENPLCLFKFYENWLEGKTLHLHGENFGCGGCGHWLFGKETFDQDEFLTYMVEKEGLKESKELLNLWFDQARRYKPRYPHLFIGPLRENMVEYLKSITFLVNPDQLSALMVGAHYYYAPDDPIPPVTVAFGTGCMQILPLFKDIDYPQAMIGATDMGMRQFLPANILAFTTTLPLFRQLCLLDERSFLYKPYLQKLKETRGEKGLGKIPTMNL
ncbi:MAG TPA: DUF169 domain-containing protein [Candidatus Deferrimicrobium sp.]|nr:DUF169 domain-containing protein [Candidatus Deferrimicrobium sp.]